VRPFIKKIKKEIKMKKTIWRIVAPLVVLSMLLVSCAQPAAPAEEVAPAEEEEAAPAEEEEAVPAAEAYDMVLLPKFMGNLVFDETNQGAEEAQAELGNTGELEYVGPTAEN
jgi:ABC-type sugar transport system substrate-binding protein